MVLKTINITKSYENKKIIDNISINLNKGETVSILGISGIGKSTIFDILSGATKPDEGHVIFKNKDITGRTGIIGYMPQKDLLFEFKTILDNIALPLIIRGIPKKDARKIAIKNFDFFGLSGYEESYPKELSGGMKQRAALLRTYLFSKDVLLLDEPFSALDQITKLSLYRWYFKIAQKIELSTVFITHDIDEAILLSDRIYIITGSPGKISKEILIRKKNKKTLDLKYDQEFLAYKNEILKILKAE